MGKIALISIPVIAVVVWITVVLAKSPQPVDGRWGIVTSVSVVATLFGLIISVFGFLFAIEQINLTRKDVEHTQRKADELKSALSFYDAAHDASMAVYALKSARKHYSSKAMSNFVDSYDDYRRSITSISSNVENLPDDVVSSIVQSDKYIRSLCARVDGNRQLNEAKIMSELRSHQDLGEKLVRILQRSSI